MSAAEPTVRGLVLAGEASRMLQHGLRPVPHSLRLASPAALRLWFGKMILPLPSTPVPDFDQTWSEFEEEGQQAVASGMEGSALCTPPSARGGRRLQHVSGPSACNTSNSIFCWMRCMPFQDNASPEYCASINSGFNCTSQRDQVYIFPNNKHGDFNPSCTNSTDPITPDPRIPEPYYQDCIGFDDYVSSEQYQHHVVLSPGRAAFQWNVTADGKIQGRMSVFGRLGWMSFGIHNVAGGYSKKGMYGSHVIMGIATTALGDPEKPEQWDKDNLTTTVAEYIISSTASAFRHWSTPYTEMAGVDSALSETELSSVDCFASMKFTTASISGWGLNVTDGTETKLIWAYHPNSSPLHGVPWPWAIRASGGRPWLPFTGTRSKRCRCGWLTDK